MKSTVFSFLVSWAFVASLGAAALEAQQSASPARPTVTSSKSAQQTAKPITKKEHTFRGTVEKVDEGARVLTVDGENVPGWMAAMTMNYRIDPATVSKIKAGDHITAIVYDGDFTTLHDVHVVVVKPSMTNELPPPAYVCNTKGQDIARAAAESNVIEDRPGKCPQTGAPLVPIRLVTVYSCLKFQAFVQDNPGVCPVDKSELVPITVALSFTCKNEPAVHELEPRECTNGSAPIKVYERRPHGDHNPRHGGQFFMADDSWHHLEGTFLPPNIFRVYFYNDMTQPLPSSGFPARVVETDANGRQIGEPVILRPHQANDSSILEAIVLSATPPASFELQLKFKPEDKERVFNFTFIDYSKEPGSPIPAARAPLTTSSTSNVGTPAVNAAVRAAEPAPAAGVSVQNAPPASQTSANVMVDSVLYPTNTSSTIKREEPLPATTPELLEELAKQAQLVKMLLDQGNFGGLWVPALRAKDIAIAMEDSHLSDVPEGHRANVVSAVRQLALSAWQIDAAGDLGNRELLLPLYRDFSQAVEDIQAVYVAH